MLNPYRIEEILDNQGFNKAALALSIPDDELEKLIKEDALTVKQINTIAQCCNLSSQDILDIFFYEPLQKIASDNIRRLNGEETIEDLAGEAGLEPLVLYSKLANQAELTLSDLEKLAPVFNVPVSTLLEKHR